MEKKIERHQIYRCKTCGNIMEVLNVGGGDMVCCGEPMELLVEKTEELGFEKHVPIIEETETGIKVKIGSVPHPMEPDHYIQWIEILFDDKSDKKFLKPGDSPEAEFNVKNKDIVAREYCNIHSLWKSK